MTARTGNPKGRPPGSRDRRGALPRMTMALAARQYTVDVIHFFAMVLYDEKAPLHDRLMAGNHLLDRAHGKPQQSVEVLDQRQTETEFRTVGEIEAEIRRRGYDKVLNLTAEYVGDDQGSNRPKAISDERANKAPKPARSRQRTKI
jgi:hypothetical protein